MGARRPRLKAFDPLDRVWCADSARQTVSVVEDALVNLVDPLLRLMH